ncbi:MAG: Rieske 2Fe-2S domain-containing protein [Deltaproteobacteria bacterium]|nr:Rieske 2Fe-2S domain-containing protein [Deltaproteobacteria bacterium]MBI2179404.1 Rieske 2Fe-2S domain-containing protein [Deltaproteobacteria bacterium]MBI2231383.1 Rieske 2Fe-2S domain-containing protein [Deltaproteobacteria bacterium]MBI2532933.1 Rieske 2Fe-2S domain-containing protein [Deltaproteobacteria bacterium]
MEFTIYLSLVFLALYLIGLALRRFFFLRDKRRMQAQSRLGGRTIARVDELQAGSVKKFRIICRQYRVDGFLVNDHGSFHAYVNRCRHMTTPLDFIRDQFLSEDRRHLMCYTHGALYEFATGLCIAGPCKGESLYRLPVRVDRGEVLVGCPEGDLSYLKD